MKYIHNFLLIWFFFILFSNNHLHKLRFTYYDDCKFYHDVLSKLRQIKVTDCVEIHKTTEEEIG